MGSAVKSLGVGLIGAGLMGKAHSLAMAALPMYVQPIAAELRREVVAEVSDDLAAAAQQRFGFSRSTSDWRTLLDDPKIDIIDVVVPSNMHREIVSAAIAAGKHVVCEKPLGLSLKDATYLAELANASDRVNQMGFNWRFAPSVRLAKRLVDEGRLGDILNFRGVWLADSGFAEGSEENWRFNAAVAGSGSIGDLGAHVIDWARFLVGEPAEVVSNMRTYERATRTVDVDDDVEFLINFESGAFGSVAATRFSRGRKNYCGFEIYGTEGSLVFDWERMNEIRYYDAHDPADRVGFKTILTGPDTPDAQYFWPVAGYQIGYLETKLLQLLDLVGAITEGRPAETTFNDAVACSRVIEAVQRSQSDHAWTPVRPSGETE